MKTIKKYIEESLLDDEDDLVNRVLYQPKNADELRENIIECFKHNITDLSCIDTSKIADMSHLFVISYGKRIFADFEDYLEKMDISKWNVSNVKYMSYMFANSKFNGDISKWNVRNVENMSFMFYGSNFNGDISKWNVSNVKYMSNMFAFSKFNSNISKWNVSNATDMSHMFYESKFNGDISKWNVSNVKYMGYMFANSKFNGDISKWDVSKVMDYDNIFNKCSIEEKYKPKFK